MRSILYMLLLFITSHQPLLAAIRLPAIFGNHMVLQQKSEVRIWGWCDPGEKIGILPNWDTVAYHTTGNGDAKWEVLIKTPAAGGPYTITCKGTNTIVLEDVLAGEVWVCSGQSNMEMSVSECPAFFREVAADSIDEVRFFKAARRSAQFPQDDIQGSWIVCRPSALPNFSAVAYAFGKTLHQQLQLPVALLNASWGGTSAEVWTPGELVQNDPILQKAAAAIAPSAWWPTQPGAAWNAMIYPLTRFTIAGTIWYQGENNTGAWRTYHRLFTTLIEGWRQAWKKDLPFYFVQIAPYAYPAKDVGALLREAQTQSLSSPNTGMVVISDLVNDTNNVHPVLKKEVGQRLARYALAQTYGVPQPEYRSPMYRSMQIEKNRIRVFFDHAESGLISTKGQPSGFFIAGEDNHFLPAKVIIQHNTVVLYNKAIQHPVAVRFGFDNTAKPGLFNKEGLPVNLFRADNRNSQRK